MVILSYTFPLAALAYIVEAASPPFKVLRHGLSLIMRCLMTDYKHRTNLPTKISQDRSRVLNAGDPALTQQWL